MPTQVVNPKKFGVPRPPRRARPDSRAVGLQHLVHSLNLVCSLLDKRPPVAHQVAQLTFLAIGNEAGLEQPMAKQVGDPFGSRTSVLRPGTALMWRALATTTSNPASSISLNTGRQ